MVGNGLRTLWGKWVMLRGKNPFPGICECPRISQRSSLHPPIIWTPSVMTGSCRNLVTLSEGNYFVQTQINLDASSQPFFLSGRFCFSFWAYLCVFNWKGREKSPPGSLGKPFSSCYPFLEPGCNAEMLRIPCQSLNGIYFMDLKDVGGVENLPLPFVEAHSASPAKPVALTSSGFISVSLRA